MKKFYYILLLLLPVLTMTGCSDESLYEGDSDSATATLSYRVSLDDGLDSRAIGDGAKVNQLKVGIFQGNVHIATKTIEDKVDGKFPVELTLLKNLQYTIVFWAQAKDNDIYKLNEHFEVDIDYSKYTDMSLEGTESFEAFYAKDTVKLDNNRTLTKGVNLTRPFAQLNIAAKEEDVFNKVESASLTIENVYTRINLLTGRPVGDATGKTLSFNYSDEDTANKQSIKIGEENYYYVASAYLFSPEKVKLTGELYDEGGGVVKSFEFPELTLKPNYRTNIYGEMIQMEELAPWDGLTFTQPEFVDNKYIIDEEADLAWLSVAENTANLSENSTFIVMKDVLNMGEKTISSIQLPAGSTFEGNEKIIKNFANSLFGDATNITVQNLVLDNVDATSDSHVGVLVNTLKGSSTFTNVSIANSSATTTNGAAGGFVGYIKNNDTEKLSVNFTKCTATGNDVSGSLTSGVYVGWFRGYNNTDTLTFSTDCNESTATFVSNAKAPYYTTDNTACWFTPEQIANFSKYSGWLGCEEFYRGTVNYGAVRYIPKWDGVTTIEPFYEDDAKKVAQIWSAFDLAYLQGKTLTTLHFCSDVDMAGVCDDCKDGKGNSTKANDYLSTCDKCKSFRPIVAINNLYGENHTLYNLFVQGEHEVGGSYNDGMGFIRHTNSGTFNNFTFDGAIIKCIDDFDYRNDDQNGGNGYAGTLTSRVASKMIINNVHAKNGHVIGISKFGGLIGYVPGGIEATGCSVDNYVIENHKIDVNNSYAITMEKEIAGVKVKAECAEDFFTEGEAGGFIGFISSNAIITDCETSNITMKCYGQADRPTEISCYRWERKYVFMGAYEWKFTLGIDYTIAGRHINTFIGDIRTPSANTVVIDGCTTNGICAEGYDYNITKTGKGELVGCCYFVGKDIEILGKSMHAGDYKGTVTIDGESMPFVGG